MVQYLASVSNEISVLVKSIQVNTTLTLTGPAEIFQNENISLVATLKRSDTLAAIPGATVDFYWSVQKLGSAVTNASGVATFVTTTIQAGTYLYKAKFEGMEVAGLSFMPSMGSYSVGMESALPLLLALGAILLLAKRR